MFPKGCAMAFSYTDDVRPAAGPSWQRFWTFAIMCLLWPLFRKKASSQLTLVEMVPKAKPPYRVKFKGGPGGGGGKAGWPGGHFYCSFVYWVYWIYCVWGRGTEGDTKSTYIVV
jgi:hypothetical protein